MLNLSDTYTRFSVNLLLHLDNEKSNDHGKEQIKNRKHRKSYTRSIE
ncbi:MAG: hypothetical protein Pg6B_09450 [Candidatus Azobacteroides pseudotrichonymphae]|jgi:hypothetical protein|nr:MAG: hypothetical protein Pg6B_09450 [Candidatus Azobacteroides pseudotrichonymphae]